MEERFQKFTVLLTTVGRCIHRIKSEEMAEFHLKSSHVSCLYYLYKEKSLTAKELCDICDEDKANVSRTIRYLEEEGYLACTSCRPKRYQASLQLTERGLEIGQRIAERVDRVIVEASRGLSEEQRAIFYESFSLIMDNLQRICDQYDADVPKTGV